jgi:hypothetical protein
MPTNIKTNVVVLFENQVKIKWYFIKKPKKNCLINLHGNRIPDRSSIPYIHLINLYLNKKTILKLKKRLSVWAYVAQHV